MSLKYITLFQAPGRFPGHAASTRAFLVVLESWEEMVLLTRAGGVNGTKLLLITLVLGRFV